MKSASAHSVMGLVPAETVAVGPGATGVAMVLSDQALRPPGLLTQSRASLLLFFALTDYRLLLTAPVFPYLPQAPPFGVHVVP